MRFWIIRKLTAPIRRLAVPAWSLLMLKSDTKGTIKEARNILSQIQLPDSNNLDSRNIGNSRSELDLSVGIVVPAFQAEEFLDDCLKSIATQSFSQWRCYIVDDASTDRTSEIASNWERRDNRFRLITHGKNGGLSAARNTGLRETIEPLVTFLDADDVLVANSLLKRVRVMGKYWEDRQVAGSWAPTPQVPERMPFKFIKIYGKRRITSKVVDFPSSLGECPFNAHAGLFRTELLRLIGGFDESMKKGAEDWDLWQRVLRHGYIFRPASGISGLYRQRKKSMVRNDSIGHLNEANLLLSNASLHASIINGLSVDPRAALPVGELSDAEVRLKRAATYAGINYASSKGLVLPTDEIFSDLLRPMTLSQIDRFNTSHWAAAGIRRGLGLGYASAFLKSEDEKKISAISKYISKILHEIVLALPVRSSGSDMETVNYDPCKEKVDYLLLAERASDVVRLKDIATKIKTTGKSVAYLNIDVVKGDEGTGLWGSEEYSGFSFNELSFGRVAARSLVAIRPFGPVTLGIIEHFQKNMDVIILDGFGEELELECNAGSSLKSDIQVDLIPSSDIKGSLFPAMNTTNSSRLSSNYGRLFVKEEGKLHKPSIHALENLHNKHAGETVVIIGNGPSLNETPIEELGGVSTFGVNGIFYASDRLPDLLSYYVVEDSSVFHENLEKIKSFEAGCKLFPTNYLDSFSDEEISDEVIFFRMNGGFYGRKTGTLCHPRFSLDPRQRLYCGQSVTIINLQLAYWMGFQRVILIGMDFSYQIPEDADREGDIITSNSDDVNHFHPDYFGKGKTWKDPKLDRVLINYRLAGEMYKADGREIINSTIGGNLNLFPRLDLLKALGRGN